LWKDEDDEIPDIYRFARLSMGTVDSPYLAIATIHYHLDQISIKYPHLKETCQFIKDHLYVDDLMASIKSTSKAIELRKSISEVLDMMRMKIHKWSSNSPALLKSIPREELSPYEEIENRDMEKNSNDIMFNDPDIITKTMKCLGMSYTPKEDIFHYNSYEMLTTDKAVKYTK